MSLVTPEIHSQTVIRNHHHLGNPFETILAIHHLVVQTLNVTMEYVHVYQNTKAIHIKVVDLSVSLTRIVLETEHAYEANVLILVLEHVVKTRSVRSLTISQCVAVRMEWPEMHSYNVDLSNLR